MKFCGYFFLLIAIISFHACQEEVSGNVAKANTILDAKIEQSTPKEDTILTPTPPAITFDSSISIDYLMGKFIPSKSPKFARVETRYASRAGFYLRKETYEAFKAMHKAAKADGISLTIKSATRNFASQKRIWEAKWSGQRLLEGGINAAKSIPDPKARALKILEWSSMPGSSRHHWGTDLDMNAFVNSYFEKGRGLKEYNWLVANAPSFGFCQPYSPKGSERPYGYNEEKWHWSYLPLATRLSDQCKLRLKNEMIEGFKGSETAVQIGIIEKYVLGINADCL